MSKITDLHEEIYDFLLQKREAAIEQGLRLDFTLRAENKDKKIEKGYWFYGNEKQVIISFWSGNDWLFETPNIFFAITTSGDCSLNLSCGDSSSKGVLFRNFIQGPLDLVLKGSDRWQKHYPKSAYLSILDYFLAEDKVKIDMLLRHNSSELYLDDPKNTVGPINPSDFDVWLDNIKNFRNKTRAVTMPYALAELKIEKYGPIKKLELTTLPKDSPFIFLTGENGTGKTTLLKAIATSLAYEKLEPQYEMSDDAWQLSFRLITPTSTSSHIINLEGNITKEPPFVPFCCYGASRLDIEDRMYVGKKTKHAPRMHPFYSLFSHDAVFYDLNQWLVKSLSRSDAETRMKYNSIKKMLIDIIPNIFDITDDKIEDSQELLYHELDTDANQINGGVPFRRLSSGIKSLIVLLGDMMIRLFAQQPSINEPSTLKGIVLIDEIDIHLHPKWQRELPHILHRYFPYVQFIVTTHSPIPLLGAPKRSRIFVISRERDLGVVAERLDDQLQLGNLLPNTILTSPIFGMQSIIPDSNTNLLDLNTERSYQKVEDNKLTRKRLREIANKIKNEKN